MQEFTTASQIIHSTQSSVSKSIASMENILGFPLFVRNRNKLELTDAGTLLFKEWRSIVRNVELSIDKAFLLAERGKNSLVIGEPDSMKTDKDYLPAINRFRERYKDISLMFVEVPISELISRLVSNEIDIIFTIDYELPTLNKLGIPWKPVADSPFITITMHVSNPLAAKESITLGDLKDEDFIVLAPSLHQNYIDLLFALCKLYGFLPKISVCAPNPRSMMTTLLRTKTGVVMDNRFIYDANSSQLKHFTLDNTYSRLIVAWKSNVNNPFINRFVDVVTADYVPMK